MPILISFLYLCLHIAIIILVAVGIVWLLKLVFNITIDGEVYKWGKIVVALLVIIAIVVWLAGVLGGSPIYSFRFR